ncbi:hypothetical protein OG225_38655 [Nocardia sp. NBC_01377]|uniref:hypothetical protein n=1 Tax=Nocardia sp. NBC_01377 TaxID=2903595 RepID=UPI003245F52C
MSDRDEKTLVAGAGPLAGGGLPDLGFTLGAPLGAIPAVEPVPVAEGTPASAEPGEVTGAEPEVAGEVAGEIPSPDLEQTPEERGHELAVRIAHELGEMGPQGWRELTAVFTLTVELGGGEVLYVGDEDQVLRVAVPDGILEIAAEHRRVSAMLGDGPWWRLFMRLDADGQLEVDYDYGDEPFPDEQLFAPEAYLADLEEFPRQRLPVWLAAYLFHDGRQTRPATYAAQQARADRAAGVAAVESHVDLPDLPTTWVRWTVMSAAFVAVRSEWGPRIMPSFGWFEGSRRSGATLYLLPRGRAVLSGGVWDAPALAAAYQDGAELPKVYAGAPEWVVDQVLNARAGSGLLSFCYWWSDEQWYRGESPGGPDLGEAVPGIWDDDSVEQVIRDLIGAGPDDPRAAHVGALLTAGFEGDITRAHLLAVFGEEADIDAAMNQLTMSGAATVES